MMSEDVTNYVYFAQVRGGGPIKIGSSMGPMKRIASLQSWCPFPLDFVCMIPGGTIAERVLHEAQKGFCIHSEWFEPNEALSEIIAHAKAHGCLPHPLQDEVDQREAAWWDDEEVRQAAHEEAWARAMRGECKPKEPGGRGRPSGRMTGAALRKFQEKRVAADARRRASRGHGRKIDFLIVANPKPN